MIGLEIKKEPGFYYSEEDVAKMFGMKIRSFRTHRSVEANHPPYVKLGRKTVYPGDQLFQWLNRRTKRNGRL